MPTSTIQFYDNLRHATSQEEKDRIIAEAFEALEHRYPNLSEMVTRTQLSETELRLKKEIGKTNERITQTNEHIAEIKSDLQKEIGKTNERIAETKVSLIKWVIGLMLGQTAILLAAANYALKIATG